MKHLFLNILAIILTIVITACAHSKAHTLETSIPLLIITDFGRDIDDAQAFAYLAKNNNSTVSEQMKFKIAGVIATGYIPTIRAKSLELFLNLYGISAPISIGDPEKTEQQINDYFASHTINGKPYEITLLEKLGSYKPNKQLWGKMQDSSYILKYTSANKLIDSLLQIYPRELRVVILAQATQLAKYIEKSQSLPQFHTIYIQGQCDTSTKGAIKPNFAAYNLREDSLAANTIFRLQNTTPFIFLSKHATYPLAFTKEETETIGELGDAGDYLKTGAYMGLQCFLERDPSTFYKIFKAYSLDSLKIVNNPYDLLTVIAIHKPELFAADTIYTGNIPHILMDKHIPQINKKAFWFW